MARVTVRYGCGCGYSTSNLEAAITHSDDKGHTLSAAGEIRHEKPKAAASVLSDIPQTDFNAMRARLGK